MHFRCAYRTCYAHRKCIPPLYCIVFQKIKRKCVTERKGNGDDSWNCADMRDLCCKILREILPSTCRLVFINRAYHIGQQNVQDACQSPMSQLCIRLLCAKQQLLLAQIQQSLRTPIVKPTTARILRPTPARNLEKSPSRERPSCGQRQQESCGLRLQDTFKQIKSIKYLSLTYSKTDSHFGLRMTFPFHKQSLRLTTQMPSKCVKF